MRNRLRWWYGIVERRHIYYIATRVNQMEDSQIKRGRGSARTTITKTFKKT